MSKTLSAEELAELKANHREGKPCAGMCLESKAVATIEALQAEVTTLRTALEEAAGLFNEMHLPLHGHRAARCTLSTYFCLTAEHVQEALHGRE